MHKIAFLLKNKFQEKYNFFVAFNGKVSYKSILLAAFIKKFAH